MRARLIIVVWLGSTVTAIAAPPTYNELMRTGQRLEAEGKPAEAVAAFTACVALAPHDPAALAELGWAQFKAADLPNADLTTRKALANTKLPAQRAAILYNLARIEEASGGSAVASSYFESLQLRANEEVRARLELVAPTLAEAQDPFTTRPMAGPFKSTAAFCAAPLHLPLDDTGHDFACSCGDATKRDDTYSEGVTYSGRAVKGAPFERLVVFPRKCTATTNDPVAVGKFLEVEVGALVGGRWFVGPLQTLDPNAHGGVAAHIREITVADGQARIDYTIGGNYVHREDDSEWSARATVVIGVGPAKTPSLTHPIVFEQSGIRRGSQSLDRVRIHRTLTFTTTGAVDLEGDPDGLDDLDPQLGAAMRGEHAIVFQ